ncbi:MAG: hypothetical protein IMZ52_00585 [Actinobacteria bacterium]|nr:hypothetical protein [Bacteroidota bacterium]MBE3093497.1 hypothetical protein [Actinomycetota bacterium]
MVSESIKQKISELWADTADGTTTEFYDWREHPLGEDWDVAFELTEKEMENEDWFPMMNYRYPIPDFDEKHLSTKDIKKALQHVALTVVTDLKSDEKYLALTGGGMDMSWDIVKAYANLGFAPPARFCRNLPSMAGMRLTPDNEEAIEACRKSLSYQSGWNQRGLESLNDLEKTMRVNLKQYKEERRLKK